MVELDAVNRILEGECELKDPRSMDAGVDLGLQPLDLVVEHMFEENAYQCFLVLSYGFKNLAFIKSYGEQVNVFLLVFDIVHKGEHIRLVDGLDEPCDRCLPAEERICEHNLLLVEGKEFRQHVFRNEQYVLPIIDNVVGQVFRILIH